jgi:hypothetical protein
MKNKKIFAFLLLLALSPFLITQGCGQMAYGPNGFEGDSSSGSLSSAGGGGDYGPAPNITANPVALLSAEQVLKSMSSVTATPISTSIMNEYNNRQSVLGSDYDLNLVTSPMLIGLTNLASQVCKEAIARESAMSANQRRFMASVDFSKPASSVSNTIYDSVINNFAMSFWGRDLTADEETILLQGRSEFMSALSSNDAKSNNSTSNLMLFTCTGMLASFDAYSF